MKVSSVSVVAHQLTRFRPFNCYLVQETDGFTLIDTGFKGAGKQILEIAAGLGSPIRRIALTHAHGDHVGSVDELVALSNSLEIAASQRSIPLLRQPPDKTHPQGEAGGEIKGSFPGMHTRVTHEVGNGDLFGSLRARRNIVCRGRAHLRQSALRARLLAVVFPDAEHVHLEQDDRP